MLIFAQMVKDFKFQEFQVLFFSFFFKIWVKVAIHGLLGNDCKLGYHVSLPLIVLILRKDISV